MKKLLVIGAGFLQDFVIQKAVSMGYYTLAVDADPQAIGFTHAHKYAVINIVDEKACLEYAKVMRMRYGLENGRQQTLEDVGKALGVTRERIRQIEAKALRKLKHYSRSKKLQGYID